MSHRRVALSVGLFIIVTSVLILISFMYVIEKKGLFESQTQYKLIANNAEDIEVGMPILFSGFEIGQVDKLALYEDGEVLITISVPEHNTKWMRSDAVFILDKPLIGKPKITLTSSMQSSPLNVQSISRMQIKDGINEIISNIQPVVLELQNIVSNVNGLSSSFSDLNASSASASELAASNLLRSTISTFNLALSDIRSLVQNTDKGISEVRSDIIKPAKNNMKELDTILKDVNSKLKEIDNTVRIIGQSDKDIASFKDEMNVLLKEVTELSTRINSVIGAEPKKSIELP